MEERRFKAVAMAFELMAEILKDGWCSPFGEELKTESEIPKDAYIISSYVNQNKMIGYFIFYHDSFPIVELGELIPIAESPTVHRRLI